MQFAIQELREIVCVCTLLFKVCFSHIDIIFGLQYTMGNAFQLRLPCAVFLHHAFDFVRIEDVAIRGIDLQPFHGRGQRRIERIIAEPELGKVK